MATREAFIQELEGLNQELNAMSQMVQDAIDSSFQALTSIMKSWHRRLSKETGMWTIWSERSRHTA